MGQVTSGLRSILSTPTVYRLFQNILGAKYQRIMVSKDYFKLDCLSRVLDIGCGTADILDVLPESIEYVGFDASTEYIDFARRKYSKRNAIFFAKLVSEAELDDLGRFDLVIASGILHHLDDANACNLFSVGKRALSDDGRLFTIDPCFVTRQSMISKWLISSDRGQNVRSPSRYRELARRVFTNVELHHRNDLLKVPYDHAIMICK